MTSLAVLLLFLLFLAQAAGSLAEWLNLKTLGSALPAEFSGVFDETQYKRSQEYARARTHFHLFTSWANFAAVAAFWLSGGFNFVDVRVRALDWPSLPAGLLYVALLAMAADILSLPFQAYSTFVLEERFGFNKTTVTTFIMDKLKSWMLVALLGGVILSVVFLFFEKAGPWAWVWGWAAVSVFQVVLHFVALTWIMPLFNKFTPLAEGELRAAIFALARKLNFPLTNLFVIDGSRRSAKTNAFFTGFGKNKRIALFDTLIEKHTVPELVAVLAHEIGHYKKGHVLKGMVLQTINMGLTFYLLSLFLGQKALFDAFRPAEPSVYAGLVLFSLVYSPVSFLMSIGFNALSRRHERQADRFAAETTAPRDLASALKTLSVSNLSHLTPHPFYVALNYSHPPVLERIRALN